MIIYSISKINARVSHTATIIPVIQSPLNFVTTANNTPTINVTNAVSKCLKKFGNASYNPAPKTKTGIFFNF